MLQGSVLSRQAVVTSFIIESNQVITRQAAGYAVDSQFNFQVATHPFKWNVRRTDRDFKIIRDYLMRSFPQTMVPPLPRISYARRYSQKQMAKLERYYERFLRCCFKSRILRSNQHFVDFLKMND